MKISETLFFKIGVRAGYLYLGVNILASVLFLISCLVLFPICFILNGGFVLVLVLIHYLFVGLIYFFNYVPVTIGIITILLYFVEALENQQLKYDLPDNKIHFLIFIVSLLFSVLSYILINSNVISYLLR